MNGVSNKDWAREIVTEWVSHDLGFPVNNPSELHLRNLILDIAEALDAKERTVRNEIRAMGTERLPSALA